MRFVWVGAAIAVAVLLLLLVQRLGGDRARRQAGVVETAVAPETRAAPKGTDAVAAAEEEALELVEEEAAARDKRAATSTGTLVYKDGAPARDVALHLAVGRPFPTKRFRNGDYTDQTLHLVTKRHMVITGEDGAFRFPTTRGPAGEQRWVYADDDSPAFAIERLVGSAPVVSAKRRVNVKGVLNGHAGQPLDGYWFRAQLGQPEDWRTRVNTEEDRFLCSAGDLEVNTLALYETLTGRQGEFEIRLAAGRATFTFGEMRSDGTLAADIGPGDTDLGEMVVPGGPPLAEEPRTVRGTVVTATGAPHAGAEVLAWDGSVGAHTHEGHADDRGAFKIDGLHSPHVILWAVSTSRPHLTLPTQSSGTVYMPCDSPITLQVPREDEYAWVRPRDLAGFFVFERDGVFLGGDSLDANGYVGLPLGRYRVVVVTHDARILESSFTIRDAKDRELVKREFTDTTDG